MPEFSVLWYLPRRSMIIVCACCTTRMLFEMRTMTPKATAATRIVPGPMLQLLLDHESRAVHLDDRDLRTGLDDRGVRRRATPVFAFHFDASRQRGADAPPPEAGALRHDAGLAEQAVHAGAQLGPGAKLKLVHQPGAHPRHTDHAGRRK